jgi:hypothetical protein
VQGLFEVASKTATPLSLAGLIVMAMFLIYRQLIAGPLSIQLNRSQAFHTINRLIIFVFALAILATILGTGGMLVVHFYPPVKRAADVKPVGLNIVDPSTTPEKSPTRPTPRAQLVANKLDFPPTDGFPKIEVMVRNSGDQIAVLKTATFHVEKIFVFDRIGNGATLPTSGTYDVILRVHKKTPYDVQIPTSQTVPPNGADRFAFRLGNDGDLMGGGPKTYVFEIKISLTYNEDNKTLTFDNFLISSSPGSRVMGVTAETADVITFDAQGQRTTYSALNAPRVLELSKIKAVRSDWVKEILGENPP